MNSLDLDNYLGEFAATITDEQRDMILTMSEHIESVYSGDDYRDEQEAMLTGIIQTALGDDDLASIINDWQLANAAQSRALARMRGAISVEVSRTNELAVATTYGISRPTVRKALGK